VAAPEKKYQLVGGALCLDFCNSMGGKREGIPRENLHSYAHFLSWCEQAGVVSQSQASALKHEAEREPEKCINVLKRAIDLREAIYRIFYALSHEEKPALADLGVINAELARTLGRLRVSPDSEGDHFRWAWSSEDLGLDYPLGPVAHSAADLLISGECCTRVRQCHGDNCGWLFLDSSKNHSRCWCDMRDCGNRAKVRRHRQKKRGN
jgi:predicted RNA-binding Zn ribbon-like protein